MSRRHSLLTLAIICFAARLGAQDHHGLDPVNLDTTCAPCQDFYRFANGGWLARTALPPEYPSFGSFTELVERNNTTLRRIVERLAATPPQAPKTAEQKLGAFYASCMDSSAIERAGADPLKNELTRIDAIASREGLTRALARGHQHGWDPVFNFGGTADYKRSTMIIAAAAQGGLGLPDRDYYVRDDSTARTLRTAYLEYVSRTLGLLGDAPALADERALRILTLETALARASLTRVERRDPNANYHKLALAAADSLTPNLAWPAFLRDAGAPATGAINIGQPRFFQAVDSLIKAAPLADWRAYLRWHFARHLAPSLSSPFVDASFRYQQALSGVKEQQPRWKRCIQAANSLLGDALGQAYVKQTFTPDARRRARDMVDHLVAALDDRLHTLEWMGDSTRAQAVAKLRAFGKKIGYPDKWRDYSRLVVDDQGRQFDAQGNLRDWWTADDAQRFKDRAGRVAAQFDAYTMVDGATHVNGRLTLGENIADLGGLKVAYAAFEKSLAGKPRPPAIDGFTPEQRFFLAWAQIWRAKATDQYLRNQVVVDPHAPARWRGMGPVSNLKEFADAFGCKAGDSMVRADSLKATIW